MLDDFTFVGYLKEKCISFKESGVYIQWSKQTNVHYHPAKAKSLNAVKLHFKWMLNSIFSLSFMRHNFIFGVNQLGPKVLSRISAQWLQTKSMTSMVLTLIGKKYGMFVCQKIHKNRYVPKIQKIDAYEKYKI